ncbi:MAG: DinB family protein [Actinomycetota bacterium]
MDGTIAAPNELTDPKGYQRHLLGLLGDDDPAEVQSGTPAALRALVAGAGERLTTRPAPDEWSVYGCLAHIADAELVMSGRYRFVLAHDEPPLIGYDQDLWVDRLHGEEGDVGAMLALFDTLRTANVALWRSTTDVDRARVGLHAERGPESYDLAFRMIAGHDRFHIAQAKRALAAAPA